MMTEIEKAIDVLKKGGVIAFPTDTVWGLGVDATNEAAVQRLFKLKKRDLSKPISICCSLELIQKLCLISEETLSAMYSFLPGKVTCILKPNPAFHLPSQRLKNEISFRLPNHPVLLKLLNLIDFPITSTSANLSGTSNPIRLEDINVKTDFILDGHPIPSGIPSTVIDMRTLPFKTLRQGEVVI